MHVKVQFMKPVSARNFPHRLTLRGAYGCLEPLTMRHADALWQAVAGADAIWDYLGYGPWQERSVFNDWLSQRQSLTDPMAFAVCDPTGRALGCLSLMEIRAEHGVIEVGHVLFAPALQRTRLATEAFALILAHVFDDLGFRRCEWKCNNANEASKRAAIRLGFEAEGVFRQHMIVKQASRDTAWFSMLDRDWPSRRAAFKTWLDQDNFTADGQQKRSLNACSAVI
jgi:RimJ/RimL family protein N-acetyltransferase